MSMFVLSAAATKLPVCCFPIIPLSTVHAHRVLVNGYNLNHTALSVHHLADIYAFANDLVMKGFSMNEAGGIMKVCLQMGGSLARGIFFVCEKNG